MAGRLLGHRAKDKNPRYCESKASCSARARNAAARLAVALSTQIKPHPPTRHVIKIEVLRGPPIRKVDLKAPAQRGTASCLMMRMWAGMGAFKPIATRRGNRCQATLDPDHGAEVPRVNDPPWLGTTGNLPCPLRRRWRLRGAQSASFCSRCEAGQPSGPLPVLGIDGFLVNFLA
jgi:hypothetical protein